MTEQKRFPWLAVILGGGCLGILCIGILVLGGGAAFFLTERSVSSSAPEPVVTVVIVSPTSIPEAALPEPTQPAPTPASVLTDSGLALTGNQSLTDFSLYDDFSSDALGWPLYDDGKTIMKYENETYSIQIAEPEYIDWAYIPVEFIPYEIWFNVQGLPGQQDGTFGVLCQYQDADNYYYVEFDLETDSYIIAQYLDGEDIPLTQQNTVGQFWYDTDAFKPLPEDVNRIGISCYLDSITLFINDQWVDEVSIPQPLDQPGEAGFFVYTFNYAGEKGYKIFFDNVEVYQPVQ